MNIGSFPLNSIHLDWDKPDRELEVLTGPFLLPLDLPPPQHVILLLIVLLLDALGPEWFLVHGLAMSGRFFIQYRSVLFLIFRWLQDGGSRLHLPFIEYYIYEFYLSAHRYIEKQ